MVSYSLSKKIENISFEESSNNCNLIIVKGAPSCLRKFFGDGKPFKNKEKCFLSDFKSSFFLKFLHGFFGHAEKRLD